MFVPSYLTFIYYEFFSTENFIYWSNSFTSNFVEYPYDANPAKIIGKYLDTNDHANTSFLATGFMHAGIFGIILYSLIFVIILRIIDIQNFNKNDIWINIAITFIPLHTLITSADLTTALITHGIIFSIIFLLLYENKKVND